MLLLIILFDVSGGMSLSGMLCFSESVGGDRTDMP